MTEEAAQQLSEETETHHFVNIICRVFRGRGRDLGALESREPCAQKLSHPQGKSEVARQSERKNIHTCTHVHTRAHTSTGTHTFAPACMHAHTGKETHTWRKTHTYTQAHVNTSTCEHIWRGWRLSDE